MRPFTRPRTSCSRLGAAGLVAALAAATIPLLPGVAGATQVVATDSFARTASNGWGAADTGAAWTVTNSTWANSFAVNGSAGTIATPAGSSREARLASSVGDVDSTVDLNVAAPATGGGDYVGLVARALPNSPAEYRLRLRVTSTGAVNVSISRVAATGVETTFGEKATGYTWSGGAFTLRATVTGTNPTTLSVKAWPAGTPEPTAFQYTVTDSQPELQAAGATGIWGYVSGSSVGPANFTVDNLAVRDLALPDPPATPQAVAQSYGAAPIGTTSYPIPATGAYFVSPSGADSNPGTLAAPFRTVQKAVNTAPAGSTIVLRGGTYHESVALPYSRAFTIQSYPGEPVWFDGAQTVTGFTADAASGGYVLNNWTTQFDHTDPTASNTNTAFQMVSSSYPMAAWPDMVFVDGRPLTQVQDLAHLATGTFFVDYTNKQLYVKDNPAGHLLEASTLAEALYVNHGNGSIVRGIGFRRYATPINRMGAVKGYANNVTFENDVMNSNATTGLSVNGSGITVNHVTMDDNGQLGMQGTQSDNLTVSGSEAMRNNTEHFNEIPVAGGIKITSSQYGVFRANHLSDNRSTGLWLDESSYQVQILNNLITGNTRHGINFEISTGALIAGNVIADNGLLGLNVNDSNQVRLWNNTFYRNGRNLAVQDGPRVSTDLSTPGHDPRYGYDPNISWVAGDVDAHNNLFATTNGQLGKDLIGVDDYTKVKSWKTMNVVLDNNGYYRPSTTTIPWVAHLANYPNTPSMLTPTTFAAMQGYGAEPHGVDVDNTTVDPFFVNAPAGDFTLHVGSVAIGKGAPLPADIAAAINAPAGAGAPNLGAL